MEPENTEINLQQHLETEFGVKIELLSKDEIEQILGPITRSRNTLNIVKFNGTPAILKRYQSRQGHEKPESRARTEIATLKRLKEKGFNNISNLLSDKIAYDQEGNPVLAIAYERDLFPVSSLTPIIAQEVVSNEGETPILDHLFSVIAKFHKTGFLHGDLHLANMGIKQVDIVTEDDILLLDLESAEFVDEPLARTWDYRLGDINYLVASIIAGTAQHKGETVFDEALTNIKKSLQTNYFDKLDRKPLASHLVEEAKDDAREIWGERK